MNFWQKLLQFIGMREQARAAGLGSKEANKTAAIGLALDEAAKQAAKEAEKK